MERKPRKHLYDLEIVILQESSRMLLFNASLHYLNECRLNKGPIHVVDDSHCGIVVKFDDVKGFNRVNARRSSRWSTKLGNCTSETNLHLHAESMFADELDRKMRKTRAGT